MTQFLFYKTTFIKDKCCNFISKSILMKFMIFSIHIKKNYYNLVKGWKKWLMLRGSHILQFSCQQLETQITQCVITMKSSCCMTFSSCRKKNPDWYTIFRVPVCHSIAYCHTITSGPFYISTEKVLQHLIIDGVSIVWLKIQWHSFLCWFSL